MRKLSIALLLSAIAVSLCVPLAFGQTFGAYYFGNPGEGNGYELTNNIFYNNYTLTVQSGYTAHITHFNGYMTNSSAGVSADFAIYDITGVQLWKSATFVIQGTGWVNASVSSLYLLSGDYILAVGLENGARVRMDTTMVDREMRVIVGTTCPLTLVDNNHYANYRIATHLRYDLVSLDLSEVSVTSTSIGAIVVAMFLVLLNVLLIIKPIPLLSFAVATITFGSVAVIWGYNMPYAALFVMMLAMVSVISIYRSAAVYRQGI